MNRSRLSACIGGLGLAALAAGAPAWAADNAANAAAAASAANDVVATAPSNSAGAHGQAATAKPATSTARKTGTVNKADKAGASHTDRVEARIKELQARLKITPDQAPQWEAVTQVMRENARDRDALVAARRERAAGMTAVEDVKAYSEFAEHRAEGMKRFATAFESLYDAMSEPQKKVADQMFRGRANTRIAGRAGNSGS